MAAHDKAYEGLVKGEKAKSKDIVHNFKESTFNHRTMGQVLLYEFDVCHNLTCY